MCEQVNIFMNINIILYKLYNACRFQEELSELSVVIKKVATHQHGFPHGNC